jgi:hypothetical protein
MPVYKSLIFLFILFDSSSLSLFFKYSFSLFLKCQLSSRLTLLWLSSFTTLGSCKHCSLVCCFESSSLWRFTSQWPIYSLAAIFIFSLIASHALLMSSLSSYVLQSWISALIVTWFRGRAMAQVVSRRPLTAETRTRALVNPYGICDG